MRLDQPKRAELALAAEGERRDERTPRQGEQTEHGDELVGEEIRIRVSEVELVHADAVGIRE